MVNLVIELLPTFDVLGGKSTAHIFALQIGVETIGKVLILAGVADKAGVVLSWHLIKNLGA
jgi:hypothetical protein